jgi:sugar lactone lactonase YvrE
MIGALGQFKDRLLGRGEASITIPIFDGALKPNRILEDAAVVAQVPAAEDLATDGASLFIAEGTRILRLAGDKTEEVVRLPGRITALAVLPGGGFAVAIDGREVRIAGDGSNGRRWDKAGGKAFVAVNAISARRNGKLLVTDGSAVHPYDRWQHDLMSRGRSGRLLEIDPGDGQARELATNLAYAFGACEVGNGTWVCESWQHRIMACETGKAPSAVLDHLPGYPSRMTPAADGGFWLTAFAGRTQLVEFVLRERKFCNRMMAEVDPRFWIAPALSSGHSFLEPLQGAGVKMRGVLKPWAPPRSYGLVVKLAADGTIQYSFHSRLDGIHHGAVAAVECGAALFVLSKGSGRLIKLPIADAERLVMQ